MKFLPKFILGWIVIIAFIFILVIFSFRASASTNTVPDNYPTIQAAVGNASDDISVGAPLLLKNNE